MPSQPHIPTYIPFDQAVRHYSVSKKVLIQEIVLPVELVYNQQFPQ